MIEDVIFHSDSEAETDRFARWCAAGVPAGLTFALTGDLGSGKTHFVRGFCAGLGVRPADVTSPTFVLMQLYRGTMYTVCHFDTYRLGDPDEFLALGAEEYLEDPNCVCVIEWADRVESLLPSDHVRLSIRATGPTQRQITMTPGGPQSHLLVESVRRAANG